jgi:hypothetical protein
MPSFIQFEVCKPFWQRAQVSKKFIFSNFWNYTTLLQKKACENLNQKCYRPQRWAAELKYLLGKYRAGPSKPIRSFFSDPITFFSTRVRSDSIFKFWNVLPSRSDHIWSQNVRSDPSWVLKKEKLFVAFPNHKNMYAGLLLLVAEICNKFAPE